MEQRTNDGKIIAITLSVITAASAIAFVLYRLLHNLITFCTVYDDPEEVEDCLDFDEVDEAIAAEPQSCTDDEGEESTAPDTAE